MVFARVQVRDDVQTAPETPECSRTGAGCSREASDADRGRVFAMNTFELAQTIRCKHDIVVKEHDQIGRHAIEPEIALPCQAPVCIINAPVAQRRCGMASVPCLDGITRASVPARIDNQDRIGGAILSPERLQHSQGAARPLGRADDHRDAMPIDSHRCGITHRSDAPSSPDRRATATTSGRCR